MRQASRNLLILSLWLLTGCTSFDPTHFWKLNRGDNAMNDDGQFSVPVGEIPTVPAEPPAPHPTNHR